MRKHNSLLELTLRLADIATTAIVFLILYAALFGDWEIEARYLNLLLISCLLLAVLRTMFEAHGAPRIHTLWDDVKSCTMFVSVWFLLLVLLAFLFKVGHFYSREFVLLFFTNTWGGLIFVRIVVRAGLRAIRRRGYNTRYVAIVGSGDLGHSLCTRLKEAQWTGYKILGFFDDAVDSAEKIEGLPILGNLKALPTYLKQHEVDDIFIALPIRQLDLIRQIVLSISFHRADIKLVPDMSEFFLLHHSVGEIEGMPVMNITEIPLQGMNRVAKEIMDKVLSATCLALLTPLLVLIAIGVKVSSPGPVFFRQARTGWNGKVFQALKFRTMYQHIEEQGGVRQASPRDNRVTPFGRLLRQTSLDELPQFFNVLKGEMSIVGPRPHAIEHDDIFREQVVTYMYRHKVKPGITGWAQVNGWRGMTDTRLKLDRRIEHDLYYIENWSIGLDLQIMAMTVWKGLINKNAY